MTFNNQISDLNLERLSIMSEDFKEFRKVQHYKVLAQTDSAVYLEIDSRCQWISKTLLRIGSDDSLWLINWKFKEIYGKYA